MVEQLTITQRNLRQLLDVLDAGRVYVAGEQFPHEAMRRLRALIPSVEVSFQVTRPYDHVQLSIDDADDEPWEGDAEDEEDREFYWDSWWHSPSCHPVVTRDWSVFRRSDVVSRYSPSESTLACSSPAYQYLAVPLPLRAGVHEVLVLFREPGDDFSDREQMLLTLLRPHLWEMRRRFERLQAGIPELSARQREVLGLVAAGYTNAEIACRLFVAESTVRKHLENAYARLGVGTRTAAVAAAFPPTALP